MMTWKKRLTGVVAGLGLLMTAGAMQAHAATPQQPDVYVDGEKLHFDTQPVVVNYRTLVPMRMIFEAMGADVTWEASTATAVATQDGVTLRLPIGNKNVTKNGQKVTIDVPAQLVNNRTMVPLRFVSEAFGGTVGWDNDNGIATITTVNAPMVRVVGADRTLQDGDTKAAQAMIRNLNMINKVQSEINLTYQKPVWVYLTANNTGYTSAISTYGSPYQAATVAANSDGITFASHVVIPLNKQEDANVEAMTMAHELMHVLLNQNGGDHLPSWVHEGLAWQTGLDVAYSNQPAIWHEYWDGISRDDVLTALSKNQYQPLIFSLNGAMDAMNSASYNLEFQDYLAFQYWKGRFGLDKITQYVRAYGNGAQTPFNDTFGISPQQFESDFHQYLVDDSHKTTQGVQLTLSVPSNYKGDFSVLPEGTSVWKTFSLTPGTHTITVYKDGRVEGITQTSTDNDGQAPDNETLYMNFNLNSPTTEQGINTSSGGAAVFESYGNYVFSNVWVHNDATNKDSYPWTNKVFGVELLDVKAI